MFFLFSFLSRFQRSGASPSFQPRVDTTGKFKYNKVYSPNIKYNKVVGSNQNNGKLISTVLYNNKNMRFPSPSTTGAYLKKFKKYYRKGKNLYNKVKPYYDKFQKFRNTGKAGLASVEILRPYNSIINAKSLTSVSGEITKSDFTLGKPVDARYAQTFRMAQSFKNTQNYSSQLSSLTAQQAYAGGSCLDGNTIFNQANALYNETFAPGATGNRATKFGIRSANQILTFSNSGNNNLMLTIYEIGLRRDIMTNDETTYNYSSPLKAINTSYSLQGTLGTSGYPTLNSNSYGGSIFSADGFNFIYKVDSIFRITLAPGSSHVHTSDYFVHEMMSGEIADSTRGGYRNITRYFLIKIHGMPVHDSVNTTNVSVGPSRLDYVVSQTFRYDDYVASNTVTMLSSFLPEVAAPEQVVVNQPTDVASDVTG